MIWRTALPLLLISSTAAVAQDPLAPQAEDDSADRPVLTTVEEQPASQQATQPIEVPRDWSGIFRAIRLSQWDSARAGIAAQRNHPLKPVALAELYTARNSPRVEAPALINLLQQAPDLPKGEQLRRMAMTRGVDNPPELPRARRLGLLGSAPRRHRAQDVRGDAVADTLRAAIRPMIDDNLAEEAEALYRDNESGMTPDGRAEISQRIAWIYYILGRDADAKRLAEEGLAGATSEWVAHSHWIAGLASWRLKDCTASVQHFRAILSSPAERELVAAGAYWAARSEQACGRPYAVTPLLKIAARSNESFYGLLARESLGIDMQIPKHARAPGGIDRVGNVERASELVRIGEYRLADEMIRHQATIGDPRDHAALTAKARELDLHAAAYHLGHFGPYGVSVQPSDRFPVPRWQPSGGWRISPSLAWAHARQESDFRTSVVSSAGAVGLMQVRPGTAGDFARSRGTPVGNLNDPSVNLEYGQSFIEMMRRNAATQGQLLKVMAAYNAGPVPVTRWNHINHHDDPLLWIESLSYWETRYYIPAVMRNMWVYDELLGRPHTTLKEMAQGRWPTFPAP